MSSFSCGSCLGRSTTVIESAFNEVNKYFKPANFRDKLFKFGITGLSAIQAGQVAAGASSTALRATHVTKEWMTATRDANAFFNFAGIIPRLIGQFRSFGLYVQSFIYGEINKEAVQGKQKKEINAINKASGLERVLGAGQTFFSGLEQAGSFIGFVVMKPINSIHKYIPQIPMSETALKVGRAFGHVMTFNNFAAFISNACAIPAEVMRYNRAIQKQHANHEGLLIKLKNKIVPATATLVEKTAEIAKFAIGLKGALPKPLEVGLELVAAGAGLFKVSYEIANPAA